nr:paraneoplastic antigen Ma6E-like [Aegilops tauschii subsp. strangulata]
MEVDAAGSSDSGDEVEDGEDSDGDANPDEVGEAAAASFRTELQAAAWCWGRRGCSRIRPGTGRGGGGRPDLLVGAAEVGAEGRGGADPAKSGAGTVAQGRWFLGAGAPAGVGLPRGERGSAGEARGSGEGSVRAVVAPIQKGIGESGEGEIAWG